MPLGSGEKLGRLCPTRRQLAPLHLVDLGGELGGFLCGSPAKSASQRARLGAARADPGGEVLHDPVGHQELASSGQP